MTSGAVVPLVLVKHHKWGVNGHGEVLDVTLTLTKVRYQSMLGPWWFVSLPRRVVPEHVEALVVR